MKRKIIIGLICGAAAGILDVTPMIMQNLTWDANLCAYSYFRDNSYTRRTSWIFHR